MGDINANVIYYSTFPKTVLLKTRSAMLEDESVKEVINILHESSDSFQTDERPSMMVFFPDQANHPFAMTARQICWELPTKGSFESKKEIR